MNREEKNNEEPWTYLENEAGGRVFSMHTAWEVGSGEMGIALVCGEDYAKRIIACVNSCRGMSDPAKEIAELRAWKDEIRGAIERSGMGVMRTSQGPSGTMIGYTPEVEKAHHEKTLEVIRENIDLEANVREQAKEIAALRDALRNAAQTMQNFAADIRAGRLIHDHAADNLTTAAASAISKAEGRAQ